MKPLGNPRNSIKLPVEAPEELSEESMNFAIWFEASSSPLACL
jgi:hypothetical protein